MFTSSTHTLCGRRNLLIEITARDSRLNLDPMTNHLLIFALYFCETQAITHAKYRA
jgi:hypothetical protein